MIIDQIGVRRLIGQSLKGVADPARHEDRRLRTHLNREAATEAGTGAEVDPSTEDSSGCQRDELVPRLGVDTSGRAERGVERDVVLHRREVRQAKSNHLLALPVLLEPATVVAA